MPLKIALLGAGTYARASYLPLLKSHSDDIHLVALWSRTLKTAEETLAHSPFEGSGGVTLLFGEEGLQRLLDDPAIEAVINILPTHVALQMSQKCWKAGKHVLQAKPVGRTVDEAVGCLRDYRDRPRSLWYIAENYRFEEIFSKAKSMKEHIGEVIQLHMHVSMPMDEKNKYFTSEWRRNPEQCPGGFLGNCGVHLVAALRLVAQDLGCGEIETVSGQASNLASQKLPPVNTINAWICFSNGISGTFTVTFAAGQAGLHLSVVGTDATMDIKRLFPIGYYLVVTRHNQEIASVKMERFTGANGELMQFIQSVQLANEGKQDESVGARKARPEEGIQDLAVIEALLKSSENSGLPTHVKRIVES